MGMTKVAAKPVLKRVMRPWPVRPAAFVSLAHGLIHENGTVLRWEGEETLEFVLDLATIEQWGEDRCQVIYLVGGWNAASTPPTEWFTAPEGWQRSTYYRNPLIAVYK